jgi:hypothetical protein
LTGKGRQGTGQEQDAGQAEKKTESKTEKQTERRLEKIEKKE